MIVADTNLVAYLLIAGTWTDVARSVYRRDSDWRLPSLWRSEFLNVLATSVRARVLGRDTSLELWRLATAMFARCESEVDGEAVLRASLRWGISAYDAHFVVAAESLGVPLVTSDRRLLESCASLARSPEDFAA